MPKNKRQIVDVVQSFPWTVNSPGNRPEVPCIELIEYQTNNNQINTTLAYLQRNVLTAGAEIDELKESLESTINVGLGAAVVESKAGGGILTAAAGAGALGAAKALKWLKTKPSTSPLQLVAKVATLLGGNYVIKQAGKIAAKSGRFAAATGTQLIVGSSILNTVGQGYGLTNLNQSNPLSGLYHAEPTGFRYVFPYFNNQLNSVTSNWSDEDSFMGSMSTLSSTFLAGGFGENTLSLFQMAQAAIAGYRTFMGAARSIYPNFKLEQPKSWDGGEPETIQFSFDLLNTLSVEETLMNWELVNLISHQNLHQRQNILSRWAPCIYQVNIPGVTNMPVAAFTQINIEGLGTVRKVNFNGRVQTIPEAYRLSFQLRSLLANSRNFNLANLQGQPDEFVRVITPRELFDQEAANEITGQLPEVAGFNVAGLFTGLVPPGQSSGNNTSP